MWMYPDALRAHPRLRFLDKLRMLGRGLGGAKPPSVTMGATLESYCNFPMQSTMWAILGGPLGVLWGSFGGPEGSGVVLGGAGGGPGGFRDPGVRLAEGHFLFSGR